jgi:hypothetical protein
MPARHSIDTLYDSWLTPNSIPQALAAWPSANLAIYVPLRVPARVLVRKLWYAGTTTATGSVDMGLYDAAGNAVVSATATAKAAVNDEQVFDVTDTVIGPGLYYIALASDSGTDTFIRTADAAPAATAMGVLTEASAYPLPATATWALAQATSYIPNMGVLIEATVA